MRSSTAAWEDVAVTDNSLEQVISALRRLIGDAPDGRPASRDGARAAATGSPATCPAWCRASPDEMLEPCWRRIAAWIEGRAALETLERGPDRPRATGVRDACCAAARNQASAHVGLAQCLRHAVRDDARRRGAGCRALGGPRITRARPAVSIRIRGGVGDAGFVLRRAGTALDALAASSAR
jgi:hypothetical protein